MHTLSLSPFSAIGKNVKLGEAQKKRLSDVKFIREMWEAKGQPNHQMFSRSLEKPDHEALHTVVGKLWTLTRLAMGDSDSKRL